MDVTSSILLVKNKRAGTFIEENTDVYFDVISVKDGIFNIEFSILSGLDDIARMLELAFKDNEFEKFIYENYPYYKKSRKNLVAVEFKFNNITMNITKENATYDKIIALYHDKFN